MNAAAETLLLLSSSQNISTKLEINKNELGGRSVAVIWPQLAGRGKLQVKLNHKIAAAARSGQSPISIV